ncbi:dehydrogenase/reductase SDR family protein 12 [Marmoricola sp. OAE513]|uniref:SDR family NAD(P)-dependent oxidoreductase n=1 Tax=Marmoricola sp. OAE513 TaxID=2817894 RepID=UPI001AE50F55
MTESTLDRILDRSLLGGYSAIGYGLRRRHWRENDPAPGSMDGKRVIVTGANSGLGKAAALGLARLGATVYLLVRNEERGRAAVDDIARQIAGARLELEICDVSDLADVRRWASGFVETGQQVDVLIHNAGSLPEERTESPEGHELTVATHVLGPVLMTELLRPVLSGARVVLVSSGGMYAQKLPVDDPDFEEGTYRGATAYARSKRIQVALTPVLQQRWQNYGISVHAMHPGWADTPGVADSLPVFRALTRPVLRDAEQGADTIVWLAATQPGVAGGGFWHDRVQRPTSYRSGTEETPAEVERMWTWVAEAAGIER